MIIGIGVDLVHIPRMERALDRWGDRFKRKVFSESEIVYSESHKKSGQHFAANFAVKEAFYKALGGNLKHNVRIVDVQVQRDASGKPHINLSGRAKYAAELTGVNYIHTSISHDGEYSVAVVILEK